MIKRCPYNSLPNVVKEMGNEGILRSPWLPEACVICLRRALADPSNKRHIINTTIATYEALRSLGIEPTELDIDEDSGIKVEEGFKRTAVEEKEFDLGSTRGAWPLVRTETSFNCYLEL